MTPRSATPTRPTRQSAERATDTFIEQLTSFHRDGELDIDNAARTLLEHLRPLLAPDALDELEQAIATDIGRWRLQRSRMHTDSAWMLSREMPVRIALDQALTPWEGLADLQAAEGELLRLREHFIEVRTQLQQAVTDTDLDTVMHLRTIVAIDIPAQVAQAQDRVFELRIDQARARLVPVEARRAEAQEQLDLAKQAEVDAEAVLLTAQVRRGVAERAASDFGPTDDSVETLQAERASAADHHREEQRARLQRLAGLTEGSDERL